MSIALRYRLDSVHPSSLKGVGGAHCQCSPHIQYTPEHALKFNSQVVHLSLRNDQEDMNEICGENVRAKIVEYDEHLRLINKEALKATYLLGLEEGRKWLEEGRELSGYSERSLQSFVKFNDFIHTFSRFLRVGDVAFTVLYSKITQLQMMFKDNPGIGKRWRKYFAEKVLEKEDIEPAWKNQLR